jgi:hypothetical protein
MRYFPKRARKKQNISLLLKVCPNCLGDLVTRLNVSGVYYLCIQCNEVVKPARKPVALPEPKIATQARDFFPGTEPTLT